MKKLFSLLLFIGLANVGHTQCEGVTMSIIYYGPTCYGSMDGSVTLNSIGTSGPVIFEITDIDGNLLNITGSNTANSIGESWYFLSLEDEEGCIITDSLFLEDPGLMAADITIVGPTYFGSCDGYVVVDTVYNYSGDFSNIGYYWSTGFGGIEQDSIYDLCGDTYSLTLNDENGCSTIESIIVVEPPVMEIEFTIFAATILDTCDAAIFIDTSYYFTGEYTEIVCVLSPYSTDTISIDEMNTIDDICSGTYTLTVIDENGATVDTTIFVGNFASVNEYTAPTFDVFSNTDTKQITILGDLDSHPIQFNLYTLDGRQVINQTLEINTPINAPNLLEGIYVYTIETEGKRVKTGKLRF